MNGSSTTPVPPLLLRLPGALIARAVWHYRGFVLGMVRREFQYRYLSSLFGSAWAFLNPAALILIYTVVFSQVMRARLPGVDDTLAYSLYLCAGLLPWTAFTELLGRCVALFLEFGTLLKKVSFPRSSLPMIPLVSSLMNFAIIFGIFLLFLIAVGRFPGWPLLAVVPLLLLQQTLALGLGVFLGVLNVFFRDVAQFVGVAVQFWFWLTPIVYSVGVLPEPAQRLVAWNPMTQVVGAYQRIIVDGAWPQWSTLRWHTVGAVVLLIAAFAVFSKLSGEIVDEL
jgi:lipopolysaccharide transport system permease protein